MIGNPFKSEEAVKDKEVKTITEARMFFTRYEDFVVLEQATKRILSEDNNGLGAIKLGVPYFIDKQLVSSWGLNAKSYIHHPYSESYPSINQFSLTRG